LWLSCNGEVPLSLAFKFVRLVLWFRVSGQSDCGTMARTLWVMGTHSVL
jgi:hypothetical protein